MDEAPQLNNELARHDPSSREPSVTDEDTDVVQLPPLPRAADPMVISAHAPSQQSVQHAVDEEFTQNSLALERLDSASHKALIFFLVGLIAFISGIGMTAAVVTGALDLDTGWVKMLLSWLKQAATFVLK